MPVSGILLKDKFGRCLTTQEVAALINITPAAIYERRRRGRLVAFRNELGTWYHPAFQFRGRDLRLDVERLLREVNGLPAQSVAAWLVTPHPGLRGRSPFQELINDGGDQATVLALARQLAR